MGLAVLACPTCSSPVPLGEADWSACPSCGDRVPLPAEYRALRDAAWDLQASDERARDLERRLKLRRPIPLWLMLIGNDLAFLGWVAAAPFVGIRATRAAADLLQLDLAAMTRDERSGLFALVALIFAAVMALLAIPLRRGEAQRLLEAGLAARPPDLPGRPSGCRGCGALLGVAPGRVLARCPYCQADNFIAAEEEGASQRSLEARVAVAQVQLAVEQENFERRVVWKTLVLRLFVAVTVCGVFWIVYNL